MTAKAKNRGKLWTAQEDERLRELAEIRQPREPEPSTVNEKTIADFTRVVEQTGILEGRPTRTVRQAILLQPSV